MKTRILSLIIVAALFISTVVIAQPEKSGKQWNKNPERKAMMMKRFAQQKREHQNFFTEEQKEAMKNLKLETAQKLKPLKNELRELMAHQTTLTTENKADLKAINKNIDKMSEAKAEMAKIMAAQHQQVRSLLNDEQLIKFDSMKEKSGNKQGGQFMRQRGNRGGQMHSRKGA
ncbi:MAG: Spy/CpxP family protein refolding chaperone [Bacteroidetes bacterium]|nr:Spy/CpxP family protein refolding chaperone [Bacteroidota bacterium]